MSEPALALSPPLECVLVAETLGDGELAEAVNAAAVLAAATVPEALGRVVSLSEIASLE